MAVFNFSLGVIKLASQARRSCPAEVPALQFGGSKLVKSAYRFHSGQYTWSQNYQIKLVSQNKAKRQDGVADNLL